MAHLHAFGGLSERWATFNHHHCGAGSHYCSERVSADVIIIIITWSRQPITAPARPVTKFASQMTSLWVLLVAVQNRSETALKLLWNLKSSNNFNQYADNLILIIEIALKLLWNCSELNEFADQLTNIIETALKLLWNYSETALKLKIIE